jgi:four helix bundle protein
MPNCAYSDLIVWQKAMDFVVAIYRAGAAFPRDEIYGLTAQMRRSAVSIPSNIAEGQGRDSPADFLRFLSIAYGSLCEVETQICIAQRLDYIDAERHRSLMISSAEIGRLLNGLSNSLARKRQ